MLYDWLSIDEDTLQCKSTSVAMVLRVGKRVIRVLGTKVQQDEETEPWYGVRAAS